MNDPEEMMNEIIDVVDKNVFKEEIKSEHKLELLNKKVEQFLLNRDEEETELTLQFARAILNIEIQMKDLKEDIKEVKNDAKANGVSVMKVIKVLRNLKKMLSEKPMDMKEMEDIENVLAHDIDIKMMIANLVGKK